MPAENAWRMFDDWRTNGKEVGMVLCGRAGTVTALGRVSSLCNGRVQIQAEGAGAWINLRDATFTFGPLQVFPRWPAGPMVEVVAVQAYLPGGDWLALAEGIVPAALAPATLTSPSDT